MAYMNQEMKSELAPAIKAVLKKYDMKGTISVKNYSQLSVKVTKGAIDFSNSRTDEYFQVNQYFIKQHYQGIARAFLTELRDVMRGPKYFDESDIMTDYFNCSHYTEINIGTFRKPYTLVKGTKINVDASLRADPTKEAYIVKM